MPGFAACPTLFRRIGLALFLLQLLVFVFTLPPFRLGQWAGVESDMAAVFFLSVPVALWLAAGWRQSWLLWRRPTHPLWICMALWIGWQLIVLTYAASPWQSWFGSYATGNGTAWYMAVGLSFMLACPLWQIRAYRRIIVWTAAVGMLAFSALFVIGVTYDIPDTSWRPTGWGQYIGFMAAALWVAAMAWPGAGIKRKCGLIALICCAALIYPTAKAAIALFAIAFAATLLLLRWRLAHRAWFRRHIGQARLLAMLCCFLPMGWIYIGQQPQLLDAMPQWFHHHEAEKENGPLYHKYSSMDERATFMRIGIATLEHDPHRWLLGNGWRDFADDMFRYALFTGASAFTDGRYQPTSGLIYGTAHHSHNQPLAAWLSLGLPGLLLWLAFPLIMLWTMPPRLLFYAGPMLVAATALAYVWFDSPPELAYLALPLAAVCAARPYAHGSPRRWLALPSMVAAAALAWTGAQQIDAMRYGQYLIVQLANGNNEGYDDAMLEQDISRGGTRLYEAAMDYASDLTGADCAVRGMPVVDPGVAQAYGHFLNAAHAMALAPHIGAREASLELMLRDYLMTSLSGPALHSLKMQTLAALPDAVLRVSSIAPQREDLAAPFLSNMAAMGYDREKQIALLEKILAVDPDHRSALWLLGGLYMQSPATQAQGMDMRRRAAALGVEKVYPVTNAELAAYR